MGHEGGVRGTRMIGGCCLAVLASLIGAWRRWVWVARNETSIRLLLEIIMDILYA